LIECTERKGKVEYIVLVGSQGNKTTGEEVEDKRHTTPTQRYIVGGELFCFFSLFISNYKAEGTVEGRELEE